MKARQDGGTAFPVSREQEGWYEPGMSLRDWFAGQALACVDKSASAIDTADDAYAIADAMLKVRET